MRRLCVNISDRISSFVLSPSSPGQVFISTVSGSIEKWDWNEGIKLEYWYTSISICQLVTSIHDARETWNGLIYSIDKKGGQWMLTVHRLFGGKDASKTDLGTLLSYSDPLTSAKVLGNGKVIVLTSGSRIILGSCDQPNPDSLKDVSYTWRDIDALKWITSIDIRVRQHDTNEYKEEHSTNQSAIDIAVGNSDGCILIYDNLLETLILKPRKKKTGKAGNVSSRRMHWHRNPVLALKWSADGIITVHLREGILTSNQVIISYLVVWKPLWSSGSLILHTLSFYLTYQPRLRTLLFHRWVPYIA